MNLIKTWKEGRLSLAHGQPRRLIATPEPNCNLACEHCYFSHKKIQVSPPHREQNWGDAIRFALRENIDVICAGRIVTPRTLHFIQSYLALANEYEKESKLRIVDNGYTVFELEPFFGFIKDFNISIDGADKSHDRQRNKEGSARVAWKNVQKLKALGFDPLLSSCFSPITKNGWAEFEKEVEETDVRLSVTLTLETGAARKISLFTNPDERAKALELLVTGIPKLVQIYDTRDIEPLHRVLGDSVSWVEDDTIPGMRTTLANGVVVIYRPHSLLHLVEYVMDFSGLTLKQEFEERDLQTLNKKELDAWNIWK